MTYQQILENALCDEYYAHQLNVKIEVNDVENVGTEIKLIHNNTTVVRSHIATKAILESLGKDYLYKSVIESYIRQGVDSSIGQKTK